MAEKVYLSLLLTWWVVSSQVFFRSFSLLLAFYAIGVQAQTIPDGRTTEWSAAGNTMYDDTHAALINISNLGASGNGTTNDDSIIQKAIDSLYAGSGGVVFMPQGTYALNQGLTLKSGIVLRGEGATKTILRFNLGGTGDCISATGSQGATTNLTSNHSIGDTVLNIGSHSFTAGEWIRIAQGDSNFITSTWSQGYVGQIVKIDSVQTNKIYISEPLRIYLSLNQVPSIRKITPVLGCGLEDFRMVRSDASSGQTSNIDFEFVVNGWAYGIESDSCNFGHLVLSKCSNVLVQGCYFHRAHAYGSGGQGYGVVVQFVSGNCLVIDNIFKRLRHAMLLQACPNGNVFAYNYSTGPYWTNNFVPSDYSGDVVLHGNYPYFNLFEGNIFNNLRIDASHALNGFYNTFLRNRMENFGIIMSVGPASDSQTFVGNEITKSGSIYVFPLTYYYGQYTLNGSGHFEYNNNKNGTLKPSGSSGTITNSLFLSSAPDYWVNSGTWPSLGGSNTINTGTIPAEYRYDNSSLKTTTLGYGTALPVQLIAFSAKRNGDDVEIQWQTAQELNNSHFILRRIKDDGEAITISVVEGKGTTLQISTYLEHDRMAPRSKVLVYQLYQVDYDGRSSYQGSAYVGRDLINTITVSPNPFSRMIIIDHPDSDRVGRYVLTVQTILGNEIFKREMNLPYALDSEDFPSGSYQVVVENINSRETTYRRLIKHNH